MPSFRPATFDDLDPASQTLAAAFAGYAWTSWILPPEDHDDRVREVQHLYLVHLALPHGLVIVDDDVTAVAALVPPGGGQLPADAERRVMELHGERLHRLVTAELPAPADPAAWTLATLGVRPDRQGRGLGSAVLRSALELLDERTGAVPVHLQTSDLRNVALYERHGFSVTATTELPADAPTVWSMERPG